MTSEAAALAASRRRPWRPPANPLTRETPMPTYTSRLLLITQPIARWGLTPVDVFFGEVRERPERDMVFGPSPDGTRPGDMVRDASGSIREFLGREGTTLLLGPPLPP